MFFRKIDRTAYDLWRQEEACGQGIGVERRIPWMPTADKKAFIINEL